MVDSKGALGAAARGYSSKEDFSDLTSHLWGTISKHQASVFFDQISTDTPPATVHLAMSGES